MNKIIITITVLLLLVGCSPQINDNMTQMEMERVAEKKIKDIEKQTEDMGEVLTWRDVELTNVLTGKKFMISDFDGKNILVNSFAVWCPNSKKQHDGFTELVNSGVVLISLNTDLNEDMEQVAKYASDNGFDWSFADASKEMTKSLIDEFGREIINTPQAPVILICESQTSRLLPAGIKSAEDLKLEIEEGC